MRTILCFLIAFIVVEESSKFQLKNDVKKMERGNDFFKKLIGVALQLRASFGTDFYLKIKMFG